MGSGDLAIAAEIAPRPGILPRWSPRFYRRGMDALRPARPKLALSSSHRRLRLAISHSTPGAPTASPPKRPRPPRGPTRPW